MPNTRTSVRSDRALTRLAATLTREFSFQCAGKFKMERRPIPTLITFHFGDLPRPCLKTHLTPLFPLHTRGLPVTLLSPLHTQNMGVGAPQQSPTTSLTGGKSGRQLLAADCRLLVLAIASCRA
jgi:hypothetical protein